LSKVLGDEVALELLRKVQGKRGLFFQIWNAPRSLKSSFDLSAPLRQGFSLAVSHPARSIRSAADMVKAAASEDFAKAFDEALDSRPMAKLADDAGLELTRTDAVANLSQREETFRSHLIQHFAHLHLRGPAKALAPAQAFAKVVKASERAYVTYLNSIRASVFDSVAKSMEDAGVKFDTPEGFQQLEELAKLINYSTGRGKRFLGDGGDFALYSQRLLASRAQYPAKLLQQATMGKGQVKREALRQLVAHVSAWGGLALLVNLGLQAAGADTDFSLDPRNPGFLKIRNDDTTIDFGAGYGSLIRAVAQIGTGEQVDPDTGAARPANRLSKAANFFRYKLEPSLSSGWAALEGRFPSGKDWTVGRAMAELMSPITITTLTELLEEHGPTGAPYIIPDFFGAGVNVYNGDDGDGGSSQERPSRPQRPTRPTRPQRPERP
jgi:hypothetical protein